MAQTQNVIKIPGDLALELDRIAGSGRRSAYAIDILWRDIRRARQRQALAASAGAWKSKNHPELADGGAAYVEKIRSEPDPRFDAALTRKR
jgi:hypothetical protein